MSRTTAGIMRINQELDKISGLDGIVADRIEELEKQVKVMVSDILNNHSEASLFNYWGNSKSGIQNMLEQIDKEPLLDEVLNKGKTIIIETFDGQRFECIRIIEYLERIYYIKHEDEECTAFKRLR